MKKISLSSIISDLINEGRLVHEWRGDYEPKDEKRIKDIVTKSKGNAFKMMQLAQVMAKKITDPRKAYRRAMAAKDIVGEKKFYNIFLERAKELGYKI